MNISVILESIRYMQVYEIIVKLSKWIYDNKEVTPRKVIRSILKHDLEVTDDLLQRISLETLDKYHIFTSIKTITLLDIYQSQKFMVSYAQENDNDFLS